MLENIFLISLTMSAVILLLFLVTPILKKRYSARWRYFVWLVIAIRLIIPIRFELPKALVTVRPIPSYQIIINDHSPAPVNPGTDISSENNELKTEAYTSSHTFKSISVREVLGTIWLFGAILFLTYNISAYLIFRKRIAAYCSIMKIYKDITVYTCDKVYGPMMIGFFKPKILLPDLDYSESELSVILTHEYTHYMRKDLWYKLLLLFANAIHWFNPIIYLMVKSANRDLEYSCDDEVVKNKDITFRKYYSMTILKSMTKYIK